MYLLAILLLASTSAASDCPTGTLLNPAKDECAAVRDRRADFPAQAEPAAGGIRLPDMRELRGTPDGGPRRGSSAAPQSSIGVGVVYKRDRLHVDYEAVLYTKMIVRPAGLGNLPNWLYTTSTNRVDRSVEAVGLYHGPNIADFGIWDWSCSADDPCQGGNTDPAWIWTLPLNQLSCYYSVQPDDGGHDVPAMHYANASLLDGGTWNNLVYLWNYCDDAWDLVYGHSYGGTQRDCSAHDSLCGWWGPILETFMADPQPAIPELGFFDGQLVYDGATSLLPPMDTLWNEPSSTWTVLHRIPNRSWGVGMGQPQTARVFFTSAGSSVDENTPTGQATVTIKVVTSNQQPLAGPVTVTYATANGTARAGDDYTAASGVVTFPAGAGSGATKTRSIALVDDPLDEGNETFTVALSAPTGAQLDHPSVHTVTIVDDDPPPVVSVSDCAVTEGTGGLTPCGFAVTLSAESGRVVSVFASTANGTGIAGFDYIARSNVRLDIPAGHTSLAFPVDVIGDTSDEPTETFIVQLSSPVNTTIGDGQGLATITDDDAPPTLSIGDTTVNDRNAGNHAHLAVTLSNPSGFTVSVNYATLAGSAGAGSDFMSAANSLTFPPGEVRLTIPVAIVQDAREEGTESFFVDLSAPVNATMADGRGEAFIVERRTPPPACAARLDPLDDGTGIPVDLLLSEIAPGKHVEVYNPGPSPIALAGVPHRLNSEPQAAALSSLAPSVIVPARGYSTLPWPNDFTDTTGGGEIVLFRSHDFQNPQNIVDFVCWGINPHGSRKVQAESVGKWSGPCAPALSVDAIHRRRGTQGTTLASYDTVTGSSPMNCVGAFTVTKTDDTDDGACDADCSLREAVIAANEAPGEDTVRLPSGWYRLDLTGPGEDGARLGDLDITGELRLAGAGAISTTIQNAQHTSDRCLDVLPGASAYVAGLTVRDGNVAGVGEGGGIRNQGAVTLRDVTLANNAAGSGGGLASSGPRTATTIEASTLSDNAADLDGGGLSVGGMNARVTIVNSTLSGNRAGGAGGGLFVDAAGRVRLQGTTVTANAADADASGQGSGGGLAAPAGLVTFSNTIVAGNVDNTGIAPDCTGATLVSEQYNLIGDLTGCVFSPNTGDQTDVSALLGPLVNNRGPTQTHALLPGSPAIDTANPGPPGFICEPRDQRSYARPWDGDAVPGAVCDKGSFELCSTVFDDTTGHFAEPFITELSCRGIVSGCGGNNYCPGQPVTRQQMAVFLVLAIDEQPSGVRHDAYFDDVADDAFAGYVNRLYELGITAGCGSGSYCPGSPVERRQMAVFLVAALEERPSTAAHDAYYDDVPDDAFARFINRLHELGITSGCAPRRFCPSAAVLRDVMAVWTVASFFAF